MLSLSIKEIHEKLKKGEIKPLDLVMEAFKRVEESNLNAFITLNKEEAIKKAKELENKKVDNLLFGIPIAIKDNIVTKEIRTTCASKMLENFLPIYDATVVEKIKEKNMIIIGKTNMDEFAMGSTNETSYFGPVLNPWNTKKVAGGSSGGSAAAVSARLVPLALASDTGGSIRQPSAFCGVVGMKPTYGLISRFGLVAFASSLDQIGPITTNVYDNALLLNAICGFDKKDLTSKDINTPDFTERIGKPIKDFKIAVLNLYMSDKINPEIKNKVLEVIELLKNEGCKISYIDIDYLEYSVPIYQIIASAEASSNLARFDGIRYGYRTKNHEKIDDLYENTRSEGFGDEVKRRIILGTYILSDEKLKNYYNKALKIRKKIADSLNQIFKKYDFIIGPTTTTLPYNLNESKNNLSQMVLDDLLTIPANLVGIPALNIPIGFSKDKLPIGMQIMGPMFSESKIYQLASRVEELLNLNLHPGKDEKDYE
jgi:aspartyl-tRNA(Asn)/glutamyl-tRNA(Gln) amidotransferase subunit A